MDHSRICRLDGRLGRTNLRPHWNLGFQPNDYVQFGAAYGDPSGNAIAVYAIHDNRLCLPWHGLGVDLDGG